MDNTINPSLKMYLLQLAVELIKNGYENNGYTFELNPTSIAMVYDELVYKLRIIG